MKLLTVALFMFRVLAFYCCTHCGNEEYNVTVLSAYARLSQEIMDRVVIVHKISPGIYTSNEHNRMHYRLVPIDVVSIDEVNQLMTAIVFVQISWMQINLTWDPKEYSDIELLSIETKSIWLPNIIILVGEKDGQLIEFPERAMLSSNGKVMVRSTPYITFRCEINFQKYPFDSQDCHFGLYHNTDGVTRPHIDVTPCNSSVEFKSDSYSLTGEWFSLNVSSEIFTDSNMESWPRLNFRLKRRSTYYVINVIFPLLLTSAMIPLVFLIPPENGEKVSYLVALFTSTAVFLNFISDVMPRSLSIMPFLAFLLLEVMGQSFGAILATLCVVNKFKAELYQGTHVKTEIAQTQTEELVEKNANPEEEQVQDKPENKSSRSSLNSRQLDMIFFVTFVTVKIVSLGALFGATEWLK